MLLACCMLHISGEFVGHLNEAMLVLHAHDLKLLLFLVSWVLGAIVDVLDGGGSAGWIMHVLLLHVA